MSRIVLALLMSVVVVTHVYLKVNTVKVKDPKWLMLIYLTNQVRIDYKSIVKTFPGNCLVDYPLHPTCLAGPLGKMQVVVGELLPFVGNIPGVQSRMTVHFLSSTRSPGVLR